MGKLRKRTNETRVYCVLWLIVIALYLLDAMQARAQMTGTYSGPPLFLHMADKLLPFAILFIINNNLLIPRLLLRNKWRSYIWVTAVILALLVCFQYYDYVKMTRTMPLGGHMHKPPVAPLIPFPVLLDFVYDLLVVGCNLAIALMFQRFDDKLEKESLMKTNAENQLSYLKAQINPHFYMNMLNNIHGLIEIDPEKAQQMVIDMSKLMRFMLYDSSKPLITLDEEIAFLQKYLSLISQRYPADKVSITSDFPSREESKGINLPPLLFLVFIENAFKHGISYQHSSYVDVSIRIEEGYIRFLCHNSMNPDTKDSDSGKSGIGLQNIKRRLELIYGDKADLELSNDRTGFIVKLSIPISDATNPDN